MLEIPTGWGQPREERLLDFARVLIETQAKIPFKLSSRGWCYYVEGLNLIDKGQFDRFQGIINECRRKGFLPIDFCLADEVRRFRHVWIPTDDTPKQYLKSFLEAVLQVGNIYRPNYWKDEKYFIQILVEKIDLISLFEPVCKEYHIPISNARGWSDINQRADMARRFKDMELLYGLKPVLLYFGDFDPYGLLISDRLRKNLKDIQGGTSWNPNDLIIDRFGLNYDFIQQHNLTWIDNLISGSGKPPNRNDPVINMYIDKYGERKVEANAVVVIADTMRQLLRNTIEEYLGSTVLNRFKQRKNKIVKEFEKLQTDTGVFDPINDAIVMLEDSE